MAAAVSLQNYNNSFGSLQQYGKMHLSNSVHDRNTYQFHIYILKNASEFHTGGKRNLNHIITGSVSLTAALARTS